MSLSLFAIAQAALSTASTSPQGLSPPKTPPRRTYTAAPDAKSEPDVR